MKRTIIVFSLIMVTIMFILLIVILANMMQDIAELQHELDLLKLGGNVWKPKIVV